jgi:hypothetical protein
MERVFGLAGRTLRMHVADGTAPVKREVVKHVELGQDVLGDSLVL